MTGTNLGNTDFTLYFYRSRFGDDRLSKEDMTMDIEKYMLRSEDEMDFLPIIPLNEGDQEDPNGVEIPAEIALLPLRNTVLFPGVVLPITVGRDKSIKAVNDAYKTDKLIGVIAQKDSNVEDPEIKDLEKVGTVAKIVKMIKMPDLELNQLLPKTHISKQRFQNSMKRNLRKMKILMHMLPILRTWQQISYSYRLIFLQKPPSFCETLRTLPF